MINNHEKIGSKPIKAIMKIHEGQMDEMQNQFKSRILSLQTVLKETQLNLDFEINKNCELKLQLEKEKTKFESEVLKSQSCINEYKFKIKELNLEHEETIKLLEQKLHLEREESLKEICLCKLKAEDELEKQRNEYEKYLVDIRHCNEQNKLKLLDKINNLQEKLIQVKMKSIKDYKSSENLKSDYSNQDMMISSIYEIEKDHLFSTQLIKMKILEIKSKLDNLTELVRILSKSIKEQTDQTRLIITSSRSNVMASTNTLISDFEVSELNRNLESINKEIKIHISTINELNQNLKYLNSKTKHSSNLKCNKNVEKLTLRNRK